MIYIDDMWYTDANTAAMSLHEKLLAANAELAELKQAIERLAPAGSEFVGDTAKQLAWIQERLASTGKIGAERNRLRKELEQVTAERSELHKAVIGYVNLGVGKENLK